MLIGLVILHLGVWGVMRRAGLAATPRAQLPRTLAISVGLIAGVDAIAFLIGGAFR